MATKNISKLFLYFLLIIPLIVSCGSDDDDVVIPLQSYIIGSWHSYKVTAIANGESKTASVDKTGDNSAAYFEFTFTEGGSGTERFWKLDDHGLTHWTEERFTYSINGDIVTVRDSSDPADFVYNPSDKTLMVRIYTEYNYTPVTLSIYLRK